MFAHQHKNLCKNDSFEKRMQDIGRRPTDLYSHYGMGCARSSEPKSSHKHTFSYPWNGSIYNKCLVCGTQSGFTSISSAACPRLQFVQEFIFEIWIYSMISEAKCRYRIIYMLPDHMKHNTSLALMCDRVWWVNISSADPSHQTDGMLGYIWCIWEKFCWNYGTMYPWLCVINWHSNTTDRTSVFWSDIHHAFHHAQSIDWAWWTRHMDPKVTRFIIQFISLGQGLWKVLCIKLLFISDMDFVTTVSMTVDQIHEPATISENVQQSMWRLFQVYITVTSRNITHLLWNLLHF